MIRARRVAETTSYIAGAAAVVAATAHAMVWLISGSGSDGARMLCAIILTLGLAVLLVSLVLSTIFRRAAASVARQATVPYDRALPAGAGHSTGAVGPAPARPPIDWLRVFRPGFVLAFLLIFLAALGTFVTPNVGAPVATTGGVRPGPDVSNPTVSSSPTPSETPTPSGTIPSETPTPTPNDMATPIRLVSDQDVVLDDGGVNCGAYYRWEAAVVRLHGVVYEKGGYQVGGSCASEVVVTATFVLSRRFSRFTAVVGVLDRTPKVDPVRIDMFIDGADEPAGRRYVEVGAPWSIDIPAKSVVQVTVQIHLHPGLPDSYPVIGVAGGVGYQ